MSDFCPHCDDFSIDATRANKIKKLAPKEKAGKKRSKSESEKETGSKIPTT
jgi:hypothetical protein